MKQIELYLQEHFHLDALKSNILDAINTVEHDDNGFYKNDDNAIDYQFEDWVSGSAGSRQATILINEFFKDELEEKAKEYIESVNEYDGEISYHPDIWDTLLYPHLDELANKINKYFAKELGDYFICFGHCEADNTFGMILYKPEE